MSNLPSPLIIPWLGLGTFQSKGDSCKSSILSALDAGYRHIDTASIYKNESDIGDVLFDYKDKYPRDSIFIVSKLSPYEFGTEEEVYHAACESLKRLKIDYLDCYLIHWPAKSGIAIDSELHQGYRLTAWKAFERLVDEKKCRYIGVSNFNCKHLQELLPHCRIRPILNQIEFHPLCTQPEVLKFCKDENIHIVAYSSLGQTKGKELVLHNSLVSDIAVKYNKTNAQILLRWAIQMGCSVIPKSISENRIIENSKIFDFSLEEVDMKKLTDLNSNTHFAWDSKLVK